jgi:hypothetical protein
MSREAEKKKLRTLKHMAHGSTVDLQGFEERRVEELPGR